MLTGMATELFPTESMNPLERKRSDEGSSEPAAFAGPVARSKYSYQPNALDAPKSPYVTNAVPPIASQRNNWNCMTSMNEKNRTYVAVAASLSP